MHVAAIYDVHANLPALEAVIEEIRQAKVEQIIVGGDVVPGPMCRETIAYLLDLDIPALFIQGNGDREVAAQINGIETDWFRTTPERWREPVRSSAQQLDAEHSRLLASWPKALSLEIPRLGEVVFCHATPRNDTEMFTRQTPEAALLPVFAGVDAPVVVCGHTHMQFDRVIGKTRAVNAGSVGMPFGKPGAYWLLLGPEVQLRRTRYDLAKAAERIRCSQYPQAEEFAARNILQPPSEAASLETFARVEIK